MALPQTAAEFELFSQTWRANRIAWRISCGSTFFPPLLDRIVRLTFPPRPRTDDMVQMCLDLGVRIPDEQPKRFDDLTIKWRK